MSSLQWPSLLHTSSRFSSAGSCSSRNPLLRAFPHVSSYIPAKEKCCHVLFIEGSGEGCGGGVGGGTKLQEGGAFRASSWEVSQNPTFILEPPLLFSLPLQLDNAAPYQCCSPS